MIRRLTLIERVLWCVLDRLDAYYENGCSAQYEKCGTDIIILPRRLWMARSLRNRVAYYLERLSNHEFNKAYNR